MIIGWRLEFRFCFSFAQQQHEKTKKNNIVYMLRLPWNLHLKQRSRINFPPDKSKYTTAELGAPFASRGSHLPTPWLWPGALCIIIDSIFVFVLIGINCVAVFHDPAMGVYICIW